MCKRAPPHCSHQPFPFNSKVWENCCLGPIQESPAPPCQNWPPQTLQGLLVGGQDCLLLVRGNYNFPQGPNFCIIFALNIGYLV